MLRMPCYRYYATSAILLMIRYIWAIFLRAGIICLQLVKIDILDPSGGVLYTLLQFCSCWIYKIQVWRHPDLKDPNSEIYFRWVLDPSNMGCPCFCYFSEGSRTRPDGPIKKIPKLLARFDFNLQLFL